MDVEHGELAGGKERKCTYVCMHRRGVLREGYLKYFKYQMERTKAAFTNRLQ